MRFANGIDDLAGEEQERVDLVDLLEWTIHLSDMFRKSAPNVPTESVANNRKVVIKEIKVTVVKMEIVAKI